VSGGSYNYLTHVLDLEDLLQKRIELGEMAERLEGLDEASFPGAEIAAQETRELEVLLRRWERHAETRIRLLKDVWHDVEWWDSNDYGPDQVKQGLRKLVDPGGD
jgi:hypothetical protein